MLKRVPAIPELTPEEEKKNLAGYYRICILGVEDNAAKFELVRSRRSTQRGSKTDDKSNHSKKKTNSQSRKSKSNTSSKSSSTESKVDIDAKKSQANRANSGSSRTKNDCFFDKFDKEYAGDFDSDDSTNDPTLVSDAQVKVLQSSVKNLKAKLLEKCKEIENLERKLASKDDELEKLRNLNILLQEKVLDALPAMVISRPLSHSSSRSSSVSSSRASSYERLPACSRSRTVSGSSMSSCSSIQRYEPTTPVSQKRKTPPSTPHQSAMKKSTWTTPGSQVNDNHTAQPLASSKPLHCPMIEKRTPTPSNANEMDIRVHQSCENVDDFLDAEMLDFNSPPSPLKRQNSHDSSSVTITNSTDNEQSFNDDGRKALKSPNRVLADESNKTEEGLVQFCKGYEVNKMKLSKIEERPLAKTEDGTYVKELAVLVFTHKTLFNSSIKERKYSSKMQGSGQENMAPRKMLDATAVGAIRLSLENRVKKEYSGSIPSHEFTRFSKTTVNRYIYEKMKKLRKNPHLKELAETSQAVTEQQQQTRNDDSTTED